MDCPADLSYMRSKNKKTDKFLKIAVALKKSESKSESRKGDNGLLGLNVCRESCRNV